MSAAASAALSQIRAGQSLDGLLNSGPALEGALIVDGTLDKDAEQKRLEMEMQRVRCIPFYLLSLLAISHSFHFFKSDAKELKGRDERSA